MSAVQKFVAQPSVIIDATTTPPELLALAVQSGASIEHLSKLLDLQQRWEATVARKAYVTAMSAFKADAPRIDKTKPVVAGMAKYKHATLGDASAKINEALARHQLSYAWQIDQSDPKGWVSVSCTITHELGHSEAVTMRAPPDTSGKKNAIQEIASTVSYLQRYTLLAAVGLAPQDADDDARSGYEKTRIVADEQGGPTEPSDPPPPKRRREHAPASVDDANEITEAQMLRIISLSTDPRLPAEKRAKFGEVIEGKTTLTRKQATGWILAATRLVCECATANALMSHDYCKAGDGRTPGEYVAWEDLDEDDAKAIREALAVRGEK